MLPVNPVRKSLKRLLERLISRWDRLLRKRLESLHKHSIYAGIAEIRRRNLEPKLDSPAISLTFAEFKVFSQNGEDGVLAELVRCLPVESTFFVEFGVQDGVECNTRLMSEFMGWRGLYLESNDTDYKALAKRWENSDKITVANETVSPNNVATIFERYKVPQDFGLLSIDVDGQDYWIWEAIPTKFRPAVVVIECNSSYPLGDSIVEERGLAWSPNHSDSYGASITALQVLGKRRGYELVHVEFAGVNAFFVRSDILRNRPVEGVLHRYPNYDLRGRRHPALPVRPTVRVAGPNTP